MKIQTSNIAVIALTAMLLATTAISTSGLPNSAFAYKKNQATSQASACGNDFMPINIGCQNTDSQIQGDENAAALTAQQTFPEVKLVQEKPSHPQLPSQLPPATLIVCRERGGGETESNTFYVNGNQPNPSIFELERSLIRETCQDVTIGQGSYSIRGPFGNPTVSGDCYLRSTTAAYGDILSGGLQICTFTYP
jgi:hypothetical protein